MTLYTGILLPYVWTSTHLFTFPCYVLIDTAAARVEFTSSAINTSVLYRADGTPGLVEAYVQVTAFLIILMM